MSYKMIKTGSKEQYDIKEYVVESVAAMAEISTSIGVGSLCFCLEDKKFYMLDFNKEWVEC